jgi:hypothetical protein
MRTAAVQEPVLPPVVVEGCDQVVEVVVTGGLVMVVKPLLWVVVVARVVVVGAAAPDQWQEHSAEINFGETSRGRNNCLGEGSTKRRSGCSLTFDEGSTRVGVRIKTSQNGHWG